jgi:hypothetical protein
MSRRPFSIAELAARSRPTGYDPSRSLKDLLRIATLERKAGDEAKSAGDVESAFIHFAKASTLMLDELPTHPRFVELTPSQKEAVQLVRFFFCFIYLLCVCFLCDMEADKSAARPSHPGPAEPDQVAGQRSLQ